MTPPKKKWTKFSVSVSTSMVPPISGWGLCIQMFWLPLSSSLWAGGVIRQIRWGRNPTHSERPKEVMLILGTTSWDMLSSGSTYLWYIEYPVNIREEWDSSRAQIWEIIMETRCPHLAPVLPKDLFASQCCSNPTCLYGLLLPGGDAPRSVTTTMKRLS